MNDLTIVCQCHSEYSDIWPPYFENIETFPFTKVIGVNKREAVEPFIKDQDSIIEYDETLPFAERMLTILSHVTTPYILYIQDNFIPVHYEHDKIKDIVKWLETNNYDAIQLHIKNDDTKVHDLIEIAEDVYTYHNSVPHYPYSVHPSIWKTESLNTMFVAHRTSIYRNIEFDVSNFVEQNFKVFRLANKGKVIQTNGSKLLSVFEYIHIINFRCFNHYDDFADLRETYLKIIETYKLDMTKRRVRKWDEPL